MRRIVCYPNLMPFETMRKTFGTLIVLACYLISISALTACAGEVGVDGHVVHQVFYFSVAVGAMLGRVVNPVFVVHAYQRNLVRAISRLPVC